MWCLKGSEGLCVYILPNQKKSFGNSYQSDIKLKEDVRISEFHAEVSVESTRESDTQYKCIISNLSKYETIIIRDGEEKRLSTNDKFILKSGDVMQFGQKYTFVALYHLFVIVRSGLSDEDTKRLKDIVDYLGASLAETWDNSCTHLTVAKSVLFTTKLACALASAKSIVTITYWEAVNIAIKDSKELPKIEDFLPQVKEEWLKVCSKLFLPNEKRKTLFKGLSFVHFCPKQYFAYVLLINAAGGKSCVYPTRRPLRPRDLTAKNAIVIQQPANDSSQLTQVIAVDYPVIYCKLQAVKRRMISDTEIPLAILYCSTTMYCNPKFDFATFVKLKTLSPSDTIIIEDTQDVENAAKKPIERNIIPETCNSPNNKKVSKQINFSDENKQSIYNASESNIAIKDKQNADNRENKREIIPETCDSQNNEHILKKTLFSDENEQNNIFSISKDDIGMKIQNDENNLKNIYFFNENQQNNIFNNKKNNFVSNIVSRKVNKQPQIIPESCNSLEEKVNNILSTESNNKQILTTVNTCKFNENNSLSNFAMEEENSELQEKKDFAENSSILAQDYKRKEENKYNFQQKENLIENDNLNDINDKSESARWESSKNSAIYPRIVSIEEIDKNKMYVSQGKEKNMLGKYCFTVEESQNSLKEQKLDSACKSENIKVKQNEIQKKDERKDEYQKASMSLQRTNWYEKYLNQGFTNEILRKDIPRGKRFIKKSIMIPEKILKVDDFVL
ncbi:uncharacterized protein LOC105250169 [Camponotus floridanus]|uniref:uncharacterized protein LOC105250169 n=1 Tax=Camponotus floridanus TaxID=104421 RepID=UPI000DC6B19A|nr:uncharacterized protein LOC105250169 [Camponotus floridanus]